jgi:hypothetical protein
LGGFFKRLAAGVARLYCQNAGKAQKKSWQFESHPGNTGSTHCQPIVTNFFARPSHGDNAAPLTSRAFCGLYTK